MSPAAYHAAGQKLDTLYSLGEERTVVLPMDTCRHCLAAFDALAATCHKTQSYMSTSANAEAQFRLKPTDRLVVVFHHANIARLQLVPRGAASSAAVRFGELVMMSPKRGTQKGGGGVESPSSSSLGSPTSILSFLLSPRARKVAGGAEKGSTDESGAPTLILPPRPANRPELRPEVVLRQMQAAGRADAPTVVVMSLMSAGELSEKLAGWSKRSKSAVMRMAATARACKVRFEVIELKKIPTSTDAENGISGNPTTNTNTNTSSSSSRSSSSSTNGASTTMQPWEVKAEALLRFCRHVSAEQLLLPTSHACGIHLGGRSACSSLTAYCLRHAPCPVVLLGIAGDRSSGGNSADAGRRMLCVRPSVQRSVTDEAEAKCCA